MKYLKSYKLFENATFEDVEDILLPFIDDKLCTVEGVEHFKEFKFANEKDLKLAEERLKRFNIDPKTSNLTIIWYSKEIEDLFLKFLLDDYEKVKGEHTTNIFKLFDIYYYKYNKINLIIMGKRAKEHRKKVQKRNQKIKDGQKRMAKLQRSFFDQIMKEKESGAFDNVQPMPGLDGPEIIDGPQI